MSSGTSPYSGSVGLAGMDATLAKMGVLGGDDEDDDSPDPIGMNDLKFAEASLRRMVRSMDRVLSAAEAIAEAGESSGWDRMAITNAIRSWNGQLGKIYSDFTIVRTRMYSIAKGYGVSTRRSGGTRKGGKNAYQMSESELEKDLQRLVKALRPALRGVAESGARLLHRIDMVSKKPSIGLTNADALTTEFLDFRDAVGGKMFGMISGIVKRLDARSRIARRSSMANEEKLWYLESRDPRHMSEEDLLAFSDKRDRQRTYGAYALDESKKVTAKDMKRGTMIADKHGKWQVIGPTKGVKDSWEIRGYRDDGSIKGEKVLDVGELRFYTLSEALTPAPAKGSVRENIRSRVGQKLQERRAAAHAAIMATGDVNEGFVRFKASRQDDTDLLRKRAELERARALGEFALDEGTKDPQHYVDRALKHAKLWGGDAAAVHDAAEELRHALGGRRAPHTEVDRLLKSSGDPLAKKVSAAYKVSGKRGSAYQEPAL